jgi:hypothetical protein
MLDLMFHIWSKVFVFLTFAKEHWYWKSNIQHNISNKLVEHLWIQKCYNTYWNKALIQSRSNMSKTQPIGGEVCELVNVWSSYLCRCVCELSNASEFSPCEVVNLWNIFGRAFICFHCVGGLKLYSKFSSYFPFWNMKYSLASFTTS